MATEEGRWYEDCLTRVLALGQPKAELDSYLADAFPGDTLTRDELVDDACPCGSGRRYKKCHGAAAN